MLLVLALLAAGAGGRGRSFEMVRDFLGELAFGGGGSAGFGPDVFLVPENSPERPAEKQVFVLRF